MTFTKRSFAILLSKLDVFEKPDVSLEQYPTDSEVASDILWTAALNQDLQNKEIIDLGCGTGILGIGCLLLGAKKVAFIDIDKKALDLAKKNYDNVLSKYDIGAAEFILSDIKEIKGNYDLAIQNPPFGIKDPHADKKFLEVAFNVAPIIHTIHKSESKEFIKSISKDFGFEIKSEQDFNFPLKQTMEYHSKKIHRIKVTCFKLVRI